MKKKQTIKKNKNISKKKKTHTIRKKVMMKDPLNITDCDKGKITKHKSDSVIEGYDRRAKEGENINETIPCDNYTLTILKINKFTKKDNTIHLAKLFTEFALTNEVPFMKLLLDSHDDAFYKLYEKFGFYVRC